MSAELTLDEMVWSSPDRLSGTPCFRGTRVPVQTLLDFIEDGDTLDEFLRVYPAISREQAVGFLELAASRLLSCVS